MSGSGIPWVGTGGGAAPGLDAYYRLTDAQLRSKYEPEKGIFIAEAPTVIETALSAGCVPVSLLCDRKLLNGRVEETVLKCMKANAALVPFLAEHDEISALSGFELTRGMLCAMKRPQPLRTEELLSEKKRVAVLENIADSTNVGAIMRSAAGLGIDAVLLTPDCCDPLCRRAIRVSMGTVFLVSWGYVPAFPALFELLGAKGFATVALALRKDALPIGDPALRSAEKAALILGSEGYGLKEETVSGADFRAIIPMMNGVDSLNVAAAGAVAFYEFCRDKQ